MATGTRYREKPAIINHFKVHFTISKPQFVSNGIQLRLSCRKFPKTVGGSGYKVRKLPFRTRVSCATGTKLTRKMTQKLPFS